MLEIIEKQRHAMIHFMASLISLRLFEELNSGKDLKTGSWNSDQLIANEEE